MNIKAIFKTAQFKDINVNYLNHYTTMSAVRCILKNRSLRLSRIDRVNDLLESKRIDKFDKLKGFVGCFTKRQEESYFFWKVYSTQKAEDVGVRITFPSDVVNLNRFFFDPECTRSMPIVARTDFGHNSYCKDSDWGILAKNFYKILYVDDVREFRYEDSSLKEFLFNCITSDRDFTRNALPYIVKTNAWDQEDEVRLLVQVRPVGQETILGKTLTETNSYPQPHFKYIYLGLPNDVISKCIFTVSPFCGDKFDDVQNEIMDLAGTERKQIRRSDILINKS
jgi:hypothetical protein